MELLVTGSKGLIGSKFSDMFGKSYVISSLDLSNPKNPVDITNESSVMQAFEQTKATAVVHFAAFTNVTEAWKQKDDRSGTAYTVNVIGTQNILNACRAYEKHLIHISTAYVFDGTKKEPYTEEDTVSPIEWYGYTKAQAEYLIQQSEVEWTIFRIDQPFRSDPFAKQDIAHRIIASLQSDTLYPQFTNHYFGPTVIEDFAQVIDWAIRTKTTGLYHATSGEQWSDYDFARAIQVKLSLPGIVKPGDLHTYLQTLNRPYQANTALNTQKLHTMDLGFELSSVQQAIKKLTY